MSLFASSRIDLYPHDFTPVSLTTMISAAIHRAGVIAGGGGSAKGELPGPECAGVDGAALTTSSLTTISPLDADTVTGLGGGGGCGTLQFNFMGTGGNVGTVYAGDR